MTMRALFFIPVLILYVCMASLISCAEDEVLLPSDSTYMGLLPVETVSAESKAYSDYMANRYLKIDANENHLFFLADSSGYMQLAEVIVPEGESFKSGNYNFGWPVAAMDGNSIIISTQRKLIPGQQDDKSGRGQLLIISHDAGESWEAPIEVQNIQPYGYRVGSQSCIGSIDGKIIQKGNGTMISENQGSNWSPYPRAFKFASRESYGPTSPRVREHPVFGLLFFTGTNALVDTGFVFRSDEGQVWEDSYWALEGDAEVHCPGPSTLILDDGSILMVSSNGTRMVQYLYKYSPGDTFEDIRFSAATIESINTSLSANDVPDLIYNPVSGNIEMLESNPAALLLWSIEPSLLMEGSTEWVLETVLLKRTGLASMHPAGSVVDTEAQLQHIFLYMGGEYPDRNCIYRLSRKLDTQSLTTWINEQRSLLGI
jgi:hypothetical protein